MATKMATKKRRRCAGKTKSGKRCKAWALMGTARCAAHPTGPTPKNARATLFLAAFAESHLVSEAAKRAGIHRDTAYAWRKADPEFAAEWAEIEEASTERLEQEALRRAVDGWVERPVFDKEGEQVGEVRKFSDTLLIFMLKARRPDTYRERYQHEHTGPDGGPIAAEIVAVDAREVADATHDFLRRLAGPEY
jgi:hypothetical protein